MRSRLAGFVLLLVTGFTTSLAAQGRDGVELGIDLELTYSTDDPSLTVITLPSGSFRAGFPVNPNISIEPRISFQYAHANGSSVTLLDVQLGVLWHVNTDRTKSTVYIRPFFGHTHAGGSFGGGDASSLGGGIGIKIPQGDRLAIRLEGGYQHSLEDGVSGQIFALLGISFFTR
jgi:hypothetical protein